MTRMCRVRIGELALEEEFETPTLHKKGRVKNIGFCIPKEWPKVLQDIAPHWRAVECDVEGRTVLYPPDVWVLVSPSRPHLAKSQMHPRRWEDPLRVQA